jgi:hypothetical protein
LSDPEAQDRAFIESLVVHWQRVRNRDHEHFADQTFNTHLLTVSGMVAASHSIGTGRLRSFIIDRGTVEPPPDRNGYTVSAALEEFANYDLSDTSGVNSNLLPPGFADHFVTHHDWANELVGGTGNDILNGFEGSDTIYGASGGHDFLDGGTGGFEFGAGGVPEGDAVDVLTYQEHESGVTVEAVMSVDGPLFITLHDLGNGTGTDTFQNFELIILSQFGDSLDFGALDGEDAYIGRTVFGSGGNDALTGGSANDTFIGGAGVDYFNGGGGDDTLVFDQDDAIVLGGEGYDTGIYRGTGSLQNFYMNAHELEVLVGGDLSDTIIIGPSDQVQMVAGGGGDDIIRVDTTGSAPIVIFGGSGADQIEITQGPARILTLNVSGLTEGNFNQFDLSCINGYESIAWSEFDLVVLNPGSTDRVGYPGFDETSNPTLLEIGGSEGNLMAILSYGIACSEANMATIYSGVPYSEVPFPFEYEVSAYRSTSFLGSAINQVFSPIQWVVANDVGTDVQDMPGLHGTAHGIWIGGEDGNGGVYHITQEVWAFFGWWGNPLSAPDALTPENWMGWYVAGGKFDGTSLETNGGVTADFNPVAEPDWFLAA